MHTSHHHTFLVQQLFRRNETTVYHCLGASCVQHFLSVDGSTSLNAIPPFSSRTTQRVHRAEPRHVSSFSAVVALQVHPVPLIRPLSTNSARLRLSSIFGDNAFGSTMLWAVSRTMPSLLTSMTPPHTPVRSLVLWNSRLNQFRLLVSPQIVVCQPRCLLRCLGSSPLPKSSHSLRVGVCNLPCIMKIDFSEYF